MLVVGCGNSAADIVSDAVHGRLAGVPEHAARLLVRAQIHHSASRPATFFPSVEIVPLPRLVQALAVPGEPVAAAGAAVALPHARPRLRHRPGASDHDGRDPAPRRARQPDREAGDREPTTASRVALQGRHGGGDRHHRVRHRLPARRALHGREPDFRRRRQAAALSQRGPPRARRACSQRVSRRPTAACGGSPTIRAR